MKKLLIIPGLIIILLFSFTVGPWLLIYIGLSFGENPPKPTYTYGEFPFHLEYEINGQGMIVEDTVIVEFDGFGSESGIGSEKIIRWRQSLASGNDEVNLVKDGQETIYLFIREADYNMVDSNENKEYNNVNPKVIRGKKDGRMTSYTKVSEGELFNTYKIRLIEFNYGEPSIK